MGALIPLSFHREVCCLQGKLLILTSAQAIVDSPLLFNSHFLQGKYGKQVSQRNRANNIHICGEICYQELKLMCLWRLRGLMIYCLLARGPGRLVVQFQSMSEGLRTRGANGINPSPRAREDSGRQEGSKESWIPFLFLFAPLRSSAHCPPQCAQISQSALQDSSAGFNC